MSRPEVREVQCRSALNRVQGMPFKWSLNPYRGCSHGCHYCYARATHAYLELDGDDAFSSVLFAKTNVPDVLRLELSRHGWKREAVSLGTATDPYQPIEGRYRLSRGALEALLAFRTPVSIVTKSTLVLRDLDLLREMTTRLPATGARVCMSVPTVDLAAWKRSEPGTPSPLQRLKVVERLAAAGIEAGVMMAPLLPGITADEVHVAATVRAASEHGARFLWTSLLHLDAGVRDHYLAFIRSSYPELSEGYGRLYAGKYAPPVYVGRVNERVLRYKTAAGLGERYPESEEEPGQLALF